MHTITDEQKYLELLKEIGALIQDKNTTIFVQKMQIEKLEKELEELKRPRNIDKKQ